MIVLKNERQIEKMRAAGAIVFAALEAVQKAIAPGVTTKHLDAIAEQVIRDHGAQPSFKGYRVGSAVFPASICTSIDDEVVHGIPGAIRLHEGQIIGVDCGAVLQGYHADSARTCAVGVISDEARRLIQETERCFWLGYEQAIAGNRIGDIGNAIQQHAEACGYGVVRALCGHGVGEQLHEDPEVPNFGRAGHGIKLSAGMTIAIEPMIVTGKHSVYTAENQWTVRTQDGGLCSHYEHSIAISESGEPMLLTLPMGKPGTQEGGKQ